IVVTRASLDIPLEAVSRMLGGIQNGAAGRVAADQRALRPFQYLHVLQIKNAGCSSRVLRIQGDFIEVADNRRCRAAEALSLPAQRDTAAGTGRNIQRWTQILQIGWILYVAREQHFFVQSGNRERNGLNVFFSPARTDDDFFRPARALVSIRLSASLLDGNSHRKRTGAGEVTSVLAKGRCAHGGDSPFIRFIEMAI